MPFNNTQQATSDIPDKLFFKIGEVCEIVGVQAHVLRYWETEFPMLQPQKNRSGQRSYRRKDVEMALRVKQLLYDEGFTIAGAKRKLTGEGRGGSSGLKIVSGSALSGNSGNDVPPPPPTDPPIPPPPYGTSSRLSRDTLKRLRLMTEDLLTTLNRNVTKDFTQDSNSKLQASHS